MTTTLLAPATPPPALDLDARLALRAADMDARLALASAAISVNTAHIAIDPIPEVVAPLPLTPTAAPSPYTTPIAGLLHRARTRLMQDGWCRDNLYDDDGAICPIRAIRLESAGNRHQADDACVLLLDVIEADFRDVASIASWNAEQASAGPVLLYLGRAADLAHARSL